MVDRPDSINGERPVADIGYIGRFAPSPTGPLHLGSLATALASFLHAKLNQGQWLVRIEDIDPERCKPEWTDEILRCLQVHGLCWDGEVVVQSQRHEAYQLTLDTLRAKGLVYPCCCTRRDIEQANASRQFGQNRIYPGTCRDGIPPGAHPRADRFLCPKQPIAWPDSRLGQQLDDLSTTSGDFVLKRGDGHWAYHLAVVVDDIASGVTHIVRGEDLADTTARQLALYDALGKQRPEYHHLPVVLANDGQKLSKQTGAEPLALDKPVENLNRAWRHLGGMAFASDKPSRWLPDALEQYAEGLFTL